MNDLLRQLLNLRTLNWDEEGVRFGFERPIPEWGWALAVALALLIAGYSYRRLTGPAIWRAVLALCRAAVLLVLLTLILGPQLVRRSESVERDWVLVMADRSASMTIEDAAPRSGGIISGEVSSPGDPERAPAKSDRRLSRDAELRDAVRRTWPQWRDLSREREVVWLGFDAGAFDLKTDRPGAPESAPAPGSVLSQTAVASPVIESVDLGNPTGRRTSLGVSLEQALARAAARPVSAVVVLSDGRSTDEPGRAAMRRLQGDLIPVHTVALGSPDPVGDLAIRRADAPRMAFVRDITPVRVELDATGGALDRPATVRLIDKATGVVLDEQEVKPGDEEDPSAPSEKSDDRVPSSRTVLLTARGENVEQAGERTWIVEIVPAGDGQRAGDLISGNNRFEFNIQLVDRPLRVLYVDGYPRWEQRYLRGLLIREKTITCSTLLLAPDRRYIQEGDIEMETLPDSPEQWAEFDAVILGDVRPEMFVPEQLEQLRQHIAKRGGGLLWIAGPNAVPAQWWDTPLGDLIPFTKDATDGSAIGEPVVMKPTPIADRLGVMRLGDDAAGDWPVSLSDPDAGWSRLRWAQRLDVRGLKPTSETLATGLSVFGAAPSPAPVGSSMPLVLSMRYGAGRVLYVATDETWRWRYARGEALFERFWLQMIRLLGRDGLARAGPSAVLEATPRHTSVDQPVRLSLELLDQSLVDQKLPSAAVRITRKEVGGEETHIAPTEVVLRPDGTDGRRYTAVWLPPEPGVWNMTATDSTLAGFDLNASVEVSLPDDELRRPETDHALLSRLSGATGGKVFTAANIEDLFTDPANLPKRQVTLLHEHSESLWDTPLALIVVVMLLTIEWVGRRLIRLV